MAELDMELFRMRTKHDYVKLLDLLARIISVPKTYSDSEAGRLGAAHVLTYKFFCHALTILYLSYGTKQELPSIKWGDFDPSSIDVLTRAVMEAFLVFHYVFYSPTTLDDKNYRFWAYKLEGFLYRQGIIEAIGVKEEREKLAAEKEELDNLEDRLKTTDGFQGLSKKEKDKILKGQWRLPSWNKIAIDAGFSKTLAKHIYSLLSASAHSGFMGLAQALPLNSSNDSSKDGLVQASYITVNISTANLIKEYCQFFTETSDILFQDNDGYALVEKWINRGKKLDTIVRIDLNDD